MIDTEALRKKVIDLAIQGKLTEQLPSDGDAETLYAQILNQKSLLIKEGKIKKDNELPDVAVDEIPFEIPNNWKWIRWGNAVNVVSARRVHQSDWRKEGIPFYRAREIATLADFGKVDNDLYISEELYNEFSRSGVPHGGDLMVTGVGTLGKTYVVKDNDRFYYKDASVLCFENYASLVAEYLKRLMESSLMHSQIESNSGGTTVDTLTMVRMNQYIMPLPPQSEQKRIVNVIDMILKQIDIIDDLQAKYSNDLAVLKSKIIDAGIQGKLTEQLPEDGDAEDLYKQMQEEKEKLIKEGKIKKEKSLPDITEADIPFEIPKNWKWVYLGEVFQHNTGKALNSAETTGTLLEYITTSNLYWDRFELDNIKKMYFSESEIDKCTITKGDLLVCEGGDIGRAAIWPYDYEMRIQNHIHKLRGYLPDICARYYYYVLWLFKQIGLIDGRGIGLQGFSSKRLHALIVPFPPTSEQKRITDIIDEYMSLC
ncbi:MAG: restriction endonuclease subunit S [Lachnospiraceae bacterium]|nr:restriction endonuclease subunit S [Lachnospiraceae bacterium]